MTEQSSAELIAAHQFDSGNCTCGLTWHECPYAPYATALEAAEQRAAEYAAVVEQERQWWQSVREEHNEHLMLLRKASLRRLAVTPADTLHELKTSLWNEFTAWALSKVDEDGLIDQHVFLRRNPYRIGQTTTSMAAGTEPSTPEEHETTP